MICMRQNRWVFNPKGKKLYCSSDWHIMITFISIQRTKDPLFAQEFHGRLKIVVLCEARHSWLLDRPQAGNQGAWNLYFLLSVCPWANEFIYMLQLRHLGSALPHRDAMRNNLPHHQQSKASTCKSRKMLKIPSKQVSRQPRAKMCLGK